MCGCAGVSHRRVDRRGLVITTADLSLDDWPERAAEAGLNTIALHPFPGVVREFVESEAGQAFLEQCARLGLELEYELHAVQELLPRSLFAKHPELFRMDDEGARTADANLCVSSPQALEIAAGGAVAFAEALRPTTGRYFYWGDDGKPWCRCPRCRELSDADQALLYEHHLLRALRRSDSRATVAHLAYLNTLPPPTQVRPEPGIFLEYAPIHRDYDIPYEQQTGDAPDHLEALEANLEVFGTKGAQALEYWLDVSRFSRWQRPAVKLPWYPEVLAADVETYARRGVRHITSFAVWLDADYVRRFGEPPVAEYGVALADSSGDERPPD
jgi:hypothetical protein